MEMSDMDKILDRGTEAETVSEKKNDLILVIPAYNEAQNISSPLKACASCWSRSRPHAGMCG